MDQQPRHGEPGHECQIIDASNAVAGIIFLPGSAPGHVTVDSWAHGITKPELANLLRALADDFDQDSQTETRQMLDEFKAAAAEDAAVERAREWNS